MRLLGLLSALFLTPGLISRSARADCRCREYGWTRTAGSADFDQANGLTVGFDGNLYVAGAFRGRMDFDPSDEKDLRKPRGQDDILVTSYTSDGGYRWTSTLGGRSFDIGHGIHLTQGGVAIAGGFYEKVDFDPGRNGTDRRRSQGFSDVFLSRLDPSGMYVGSESIGGTASDIGWAVAVDSRGNLILAGQFEQTVDFDPGSGKDKHISNGRSRDVFVTKLREDGTYVWTRTFGGPTSDVGWRVATGPDDSVYVVGEFRGIVDFDPGPREDLHGPADDRADFFVTKFSKNGDYEWTHTGGSEDLDRAYDVAVDVAGNVYVVGSFTFTVDFDRRGDGDARVSKGFSDVFVTSRGPDGGYRWTRTFGGTGIEGGIAIDVDETGVLVVGGNFSDTVDFDFTDGVDQKTTRGGRDGFLTWMTTDGEYLFTDVFGGADGGEGVDDLDIGPDGSVVACGRFFSQNADFDPTPGEDLHSTNGESDFFITKYYRGTCAAVEGHKLTVKKGSKILGEVYAKVPGGRVTVECTPTDPPGEPIETRVSIDGDNTGKYKLKKLAKGEYACAITEVRDADGEVVCDEPAGKRVVNVK